MQRRPEFLENTPEDCACRTARNTHQPAPSALLPIRLALTATPAATAPTSTSTSTSASASASASAFPAVWALAVTEERSEDEEAAALFALERLLVLVLRRIHKQHLLLRFS